MRAKNTHFGVFFVFSGANMNLNKKITTKQSISKSVLKFVLRIKI
jgi:hypothetical protein